MCIMCKIVWLNQKRVRKYKLTFRQKVRTIAKQKCGVIFCHKDLFYSSYYLKLVQSKNVSKYVMIIIINNDNLSTHINMLFLKP